MGNDSSSNSVAVATLHLLDSAQGHPVQTWRFSDCQRITIGRSPENHVSIVDPQVSRLHTEFAYSKGSWKVISHGRNGTLVGVDSITELPVSKPLVFQLGQNGPRLKFIPQHEAAAHLATTAPLMEQLGADFLVVDEQKKQTEVKQIAEADSFKLLQQQARELKQRRKLDQSDG